MFTRNQFQNYRQWLLYFVSETQQKQSKVFEKKYEKIINSKYGKFTNVKSRTCQFPKKKRNVLE